MPKATVVMPSGKDMYVPAIGDVLFDCAAYMERLCATPKDIPSALASVPFVMLGWINPNPWVSLEILEIDCDRFKKACEYKDFYTGNVAFGALPVAILTKDASKYKTSCKKEWLDGAFDHEWNRHMHKQWWELSEIGKVLMGTGYTDGTTIMDGSGERVLLKAPLDNGDSLLVWCWEWYNK